MSTPRRAGPVATSRLVVAAAALLLWGAIACDDTDSEAAGTDASVDATPDTRADAGGSADAGDPAIPLPMVQRLYVVSRLALPEDGTSVRLDVDENGAEENALGRLVIAWESALGPIGFQDQLERANARGDVITMVSIHRPATADGTATVSTFEGMMPVPAACDGPGDVSCGHHLIDGAAFYTSPSSPVGSSMIGSRIAGRITGGPGQLVLRLPLWAEPVELRLVSARVDLAPPGVDGRIEGRLGGAIHYNDLRQTFVPYLTSVVTRLVRDSCSTATPPGCGCAAGSPGAKAIAQLDKSPSDCVVSEGEVADSPLMRTAFAPDLDLAPVDGRNDHWSLALGVTLVRATLRD